MEQKPSQMQVQSENQGIMRRDPSAQASSSLSGVQSIKSLSVEEITLNFDEIPNSSKKISKESHVEANMNMHQSEEGKKASSDSPSLIASSEECYLSSQKSVKQTNEGSNANPWITETSKDNRPSQDENDSSVKTCHKADCKSAKVNPFGADVDADSARFKESISKNSLEALDKDELKEENSVNPFKKRDESTISSSKFRPSRAGMYYSAIWDKSKCIMKELNVQQKYLDIQRKAYSGLEGDMCEEICIESPQKFEIYRDGNFTCYKTCFLKIPDVNRIATEFVKSKDSLAFFSQTFAEKSEILRHTFSRERMYSSQPYFASGLENNSAVEKEIVFSVCRFNERQLKRSLAAFRHIETIEFNSCTFLVPRVPDLSLALKASKVKELKFCYSVVSSSDDEFTNPGELENLIKGFTTSPDLMQSLQQLKFRDWEIEEELPENFEESFTKKFENSFGKRIEITFPRY
ncbi:unnamed protein product [Moneuplotes crassus]|uniref:Uncharacterized protein n=1 Tax=Euplotes crassus TaxID=5936 RepID=A0AAD2DBP7_EUPCR|nr:unnamed protein product [Moneuplotes crassus]